MCPVTHLQPTMWGQYHHDTTLVTNDKIANVNLHILGHVLTQLSLKCGLSQWKEHGEEAVAKKLSQLHYQDTFKLVNPSTLSKKEME